MIGRDHRSPARSDEVAEQAQFGVEVMRDVGMIIHVVARQIGEAAGLNPHAVETILVETMRGGLERQMGNAVAGDLVELAMQRDRIGCRQRAVDGAFVRDEADGADARAGVTEPLPDLARERRDRGLAAGAGHRRDRRGLPRIESSRGECQRAARIGRDDERNACKALRQMVAGDRDCTGGDRRIDEARAVGPAAGEREEQVARLHRTAVDRKPSDENGVGTWIDSWIDRGVIAEEVAKSHDLPVWPAPFWRRVNIRLTGLLSMPQE